MTKFLRTRTRIPVSSSCVAGVGYYLEDQILEVEFSNGSVYHYYAVPREKFEGIISATSHGKYLDRNIARTYKFACIQNSDNRQRRRWSAPAYSLHVCNWCYETLEVLPGADFEHIRRAYLRKAKECHPDKGGDVEEMKKVNEAYDLIKQSQRLS